MSIYHDLCMSLSEKYDDFTQYITSERMGERLFIERYKYDECKRARFGGSRHAWDMKLYRIAVEAWNEVNPDKEVMICEAFAKKIEAEPLFVKKDERLLHIYADELAEILKGMNE